MKKLSPFAFAEITRKQSRETKLYYVAGDASFACLFDCVSMYNADTRFLSLEKTTDAKGEGHHQRFRTLVSTFK